MLSATSILQISTASITVRYIDDINNAQVNDGFGSSIAALKMHTSNTSHQESIYIVGAQRDSSLGYQSGVVYIYNMKLSLPNPTSWGYEARIVNPDGYARNDDTNDDAYITNYGDVPNIDIAEYSYFGHAVALDTNQNNCTFAYIGAYNASGIGGTRTGVLYIYQRLLQENSNSIEWNHVETIYPPENEDVLEHSHFGYSIEVNNDILVVTAPQTKLEDGHVGAVYVYQYNHSDNAGNGSYWSLAATLQRPLTSNSTVDGLGSSIGLSVTSPTNNNSYHAELVVASEYATTNKLSDDRTGVVYTYSAIKDNNGTLVFISQSASTKKTTTNYNSKSHFFWWLKGRTWSEILFAGGTLAVLILLCICYGVSIKCCVYRFHPHQHEHEQLVSLTPMKPTENEHENDKSKLLHNSNSPSQHPNSPYQKNEARRRIREGRAHHLMNGTIIH